MGCIVLTQTIFIISYELQIFRDRTISNKCCYGDSDRYIYFYLLQ